MPQERAWREAAEGVFPGGSETDRIAETKGREPTENSEVTATTGRPGRLIARGNLMWTLDWDMLSRKY